MWTLYRHRLERLESVFHPLRPVTGSTSRGLQIHLDARETERGNCRQRTTSRDHYFPRHTSIVVWPRWGSLSSLILGRLFRRDVSLLFASTLSKSTEPLPSLTTDWVSLPLVCVWQIFISHGHPRSRRCLIQTYIMESYTSPWVAVTSIKRTLNVRRLRRKRR